MRWVFVILCSCFFGLTASAQTPTEQVESGTFRVRKATENVEDSPTAQVNQTSTERGAATKEKAARQKTSKTEVRELQGTITGKTRDDNCTVLPTVNTSILTRKKSPW